MVRKLKIYFLSKFQVCNTILLGLSWWLRGYSICPRCGRPGFNPWVWKIPWRRKWQPTPVFLPGESHGRRSLVGCSPQGYKELETTERLHFLSFTVMMLYFRSPELSHLTMECVYSLINSAPSLLNTPVPGNHCSTLCFSEFGFLFFPDSTYKGDHPVCFCLANFT